MIKRNIILCEGFDEVYILGYYLFKTASWKLNKNNKIFSEYYNFPKLDRRNQLIEIYEKNEDRLAIWSIGGKDSFSKPFEFLKNINLQHPENGISQVFILQDRDDNEIKYCLNNIEQELGKNGINIKSLKNNSLNEWKYKVEDENYTTNIIPIILPFDENGALETVLMKAIEEKGDEEKNIVSSAVKYIESFIFPERKLENYLKHNRQILKAKFSSVISITNPDRSTAVFNDLLMSHEWEKHDKIKEHFKILNELL